MGQRSRIENGTLTVLLQERQHTSAGKNTGLAALQACSLVAFFMPPCFMLWRGLAGVVTALRVVGRPIAAAAQRGGWGRYFGRYRVLPNAEYDGRFILARVRYTSGGSWSAD